MASILTGEIGQSRQLHIYSPWMRQVKPFPSLRKKIAEYLEEKRRAFSPFTPVREICIGKKRSRRFHKSRKYRKLDMGHFVPSTAASTWPTITATTTMANLSVPSNAPSTLNVPTVLKLPVPSQLSKTWGKPFSISVPMSSTVHSDWSSEEDWDRTKQKER